MTRTVLDGLYPIWASIKGHLFLDICNVHQLETVVAASMRCFSFNASTLYAFCMRCIFNWIHWRGWVRSVQITHVLALGTACEVVRLPMAWPSELLHIDTYTRCSRSRDLELWVWRLFIKYAFRDNLLAIVWPQTTSIAHLYLNIFLVHNNVVVQCQGERPLPRLS